MAKKSVRKNLNNKAIESEKIVHFLYENGFLQSTIVHTLILLIMALIVTKDIEKKPIKISLSFAAKSDLEDVSMDKVLEFSKTENQENAVDILEEENNSKIIETIVSASKSEDIMVNDMVLDEAKSNQSFVNELSLTDLNQEIKTKVQQQTSTRENHPTSINDSPSTMDDNPLAELSKALSGRRRNFGNQNTTSNNGGADIKDIGNRLAAAGAKTGDIQISIAWNTLDDIDLHVKFQDKFGQFSYISWMNRSGINGGMLDVDMNAHPANLTQRAVENVFWPFGSSPNGDFMVGIHNFRNWSGAASVPVTVVIKTNKGTKTIKAVAVFGQQPQEIIRFSTSNLDLDKPSLK
jgi:hypothetical protein